MQTIVRFNQIEIYADLTTRFPDFNLLRRMEHPNDTPCTQTSHSLTTYRVRSFLLFFLLYRRYGSRVRAIWHKIYKVWYVRYCGNTTTGSLARNTAHVRTITAGYHAQPILLL